MTQVSQQFPVTVGHPGRLSRYFKIRVLHLLKCTEFIVKKPRNLFSESTPHVSGPHIFEAFFDNGQLL